MKLRLRFDPKDTCENKTLEIKEGDSKLKVTILPKGINEITDIQGLKDIIEQEKARQQYVESRKIESNKR